MLCLLLKRLELCGHTKDYSCVGGFYTRLSVSVVGKDMAGGDAVLSLDCADGGGWGAGRNASPFPVMEGTRGVQAGVERILPLGTKNGGRGYLPPCGLFCWSEFCLWVCYSKSRSPFFLSLYLYDTWEASQKGVFSL
jgi:hypothetical protein